MAVIFSVPSYTPDRSAGEAVTGYEVQVGTPVVGSTDFFSTWVPVSGSPFASNLNIVDPTGTLTSLYRVRPVRTVTVGSNNYTLDTPWSKAITSTTPVYDQLFTRALLPTLRFAYLGDQGVHQTNSTVLRETTGAGEGQWVFDGTTTQFNLQYVMNDDPIKVMDDSYQLTYSSQGGDRTILVPNQDYIVDPRGGFVEFATAPTDGDYARFEFLQVDFVNEDLLRTLTVGMNALSQYGLNGYQVNTSFNLMYPNKALEFPDLLEIIAKVSVLRMREGLTELAMRSTTAWRDGGVSVDPFPSRALQFLVDKTDLNDNHIRKEINTFIRGTTAPRSRGEFDVFFDMSQMTPMPSGMFNKIGGLAPGMGIPFMPWYI